MTSPGSTGGCQAKAALGRHGQDRKACLPGFFGGLPTLIAELRHPVLSDQAAVDAGHAFPPPLNLSQENFMFYFIKHTVHQKSKQSPQTTVLINYPQSPSFFRQDRTFVAQAGLEIPM